MTLTIFTSPPHPTPHTLFIAESKSIKDLTLVFRCGEVGGVSDNPKTIADIIIGAVGEFRDGKIYWADCAEIIRTNLAISASELEALQKEVDLLNRTLFGKEEIIEKQFDTIKSQSGNGLVGELTTLRTQNQKLEDENGTLRTQLVALRNDFQLSSTEEERKLRTQNQELREALEKLYGFGRSRGVADLTFDELAGLVNETCEEALALKS